MTEEQEKKIESWFIKTWNDQSALKSRLRAIQEDNTEHIHRNVLDLYQWVQTLMRDVEKLQKHVARMEEKVGQ